MYYRIVHQLSCNHALSRFRSVFNQGLDRCGNVSHCHEIVTSEPISKVTERSTGSHERLASLIKISHTLHSDIGIHLYHNNLLVVHLAYFVLSQQMSEEVGIDIEIKNCRVFCSTRGKEYAQW